MKKETVSKFRTNYHIVETKGETGFEPSETVQGQAMSVREIVKRYASGNPPSIAKRAIYAEHPKFDMWESFISDMDLTDAKIVMDKMVERKENYQKQKDDLKKNEVENLNKKITELQTKIDEKTQVIDKQVVKEEKPVDSTKKP